jgi:hypothetical protein
MKAYWGSGVQLHVRGYIQKFPDWVDNEINNNNKTLVEKQRKGLWRQNSLYWLTK